MSEMIGYCGYNCHLCAARSDDVEERLTASTAQNREEVLGPEERAMRVRFEVVAHHTTQPPGLVTHHSRRKGINQCAAIPQPGHRRNVGCLLDQLDPAFFARLGVEQKDPA